MKKTFCFLTILLIPIIFHLESQPLFAGSLLEDGETVPSDPHVEKGYMIDLKRLINKSKTNIERVNKRLQEQAVKRRNVKREQQAREHYEKAVELFEKGEYETARIEWEKAIRITEH
ncbi:MAG: hypothetical protein GY861_03580, partial [bacterium]|nr:hypothetical protein [bacterium]